MERGANWPAANVEATAEGYVLHIPIHGLPSAEWDNAFRRIVESRRHEVWGGHWGHVRFHPDEVCVEQVSEGSETALRGFLYACFQEANERIRRESAERLEDEEALERRRTEAFHDHDPATGRRAEAAERMTEVFRALPRR